MICGIGYNGFPRGCADSLLPWAKRSADDDPLGTKYPYVRGGGSWVGMHGGRGGGGQAGVGVRLLAGEASGR